MTEATNVTNDGQTSSMVKPIHNGQSIDHSKIESAERGGGRGYEVPELE